MKKLIICVISLMLAISTSALAKANIEIVDNENNIISISGQASADSTVMVFVLDDGQTKDELAVGTANVLYYRSVAADKDGNYSLTVKPGKTGQALGIVVGYDGKYETASIGLYISGDKEQAIGDLLTGEITAANLETAIEKFSINTFDLYKTDFANAGEKNVYLDEVGGILENIRTETGGFSTADKDGFSDSLKAAVIISAINSDNANVTDDSGIIKYADIIGLTDNATGEYADYAADLNADGYDSVKTMLFANSYANTSELAACFKEAVYVNLLTNYKDMGYGHVSTYLNKYRNEYAASGFDISTYEMLSTSGKNAVNIAMATSELNDFALLKDAFNAAVTAQLNNVGTLPITGGGGGASRPSADGSGAGAYVPVPVQTGFLDVPVDHWAAEYINGLAEMGIINGRGNNIFDSEDNVTRAELVKMIVCIMNLLPDAESATFADTIDSWSRPYVGAAVKAEIINGITDSEFGPENDVTREDAAVIIARALKLGEETTEFMFTDDAAISDYARGYVNAMKKAGIINGREGNVFAPVDKLTRAEAAKMIYVAFVL